MTLGEQIQQMRKAAGLSQEQLAETLKVSRQAVSKWETDQAMPETEKLAGICQAFGVSADRLLGLELPEEARQGTESRVEDFVKRNFYRRCFTAGWITALVGVILLVGEFLSLWFIRFAYVNQASTIGMGFFTDVMEYAKMPPMPGVFAVTGVAVAFGLALMGYGLWKGTKTR